LKANPPKDQNGNTCTTNTYPPAPGIPSASGATWGSNGCGASAWTNILATIGLKAKYGSKFSGDLNEPVAGNPSIDFYKQCQQHDMCYTEPYPRGLCDKLFGINLNSFCQGSTDKDACSAFATDYSNAVNSYGQAAFDADQAQLACAEWGQAMKQDQCK
jgi:hypothetical protein